MPQPQDKTKAVGDHPPLQILSLYHRDMNIYGDSGNILSVTRRAELY
ncbi:MAG: glutamine amidotransferase, partial [Bifidobacteriales bacterium]|nr:glutamine amidotransferase [Bifidobacteriales bacterium]